jgi:hypothetical protein
MHLRHKLPLSTEHLAASVVFATQARELESGRLKPQVLHVRSELTAAALACVMSSVAYLEANINEDISNAVDEGHGDGLIKDHLVIERLRTAWESSAGKTTILDKYDLVLALADVATFKKGANPHQGVAKLIRLRNALTHFVPEWQPGGGSGEDAELDSLSKSLRRVFPENALAESYEPFFIGRCLGYGSSKWAVMVSVAFVTEFRNRLAVGFSPTYLLPAIKGL